MENTSKSTAARAVEPDLVCRRHSTSNEGAARARSTCAFEFPLRVDSVHGLEVAMAKAGCSAVERRDQEAWRAVEEKDGVG